MRCDRGHDNPDTNRFCSTCGEPLSPLEGHRDADAAEHETMDSPVSDLDTGPATTNHARSRMRRVLIALGIIIVLMLAATVAAVARSKSSSSSSAFGTASCRPDSDTDIYSSDRTTVPVAAMFTTASVSIDKTNVAFAVTFVSTDPVQAITHVKSSTDLTYYNLGFSIIESTLPGGLLVVDSSDLVHWTFALGTTPEGPKGM